MKRILLGLLIVIMLVVPIFAKGNGKQKCTTIQDQTLTYSTSDEIIPLGYDDWGYNYQGRIFNGWYHNSPRPEPPYTKDTIDTAPSKTWLIMKWSDEWMSNKDCDGDGLLDRGYSCNPENPTSSACQGAWVTNHQFGSYEEDGETCYWNYFVKIVMVPEDAYVEEGVWYTVDGTEIGSVIWGAYAITQKVENDPCAEIHGLQYLSPESAGLGHYK